METINKDMIQRIGNDAVKLAQKKSLENGELEEKRDRLIK